MIYIYKLLGLILIPLIKFNIKLRIKQKKEVFHRYKERFGFTEILRKKNKKLIWIHAASIGEFKSVDYLIKIYHAKYTLLITTTTLSAANYAIEHYGNKIIHQFAPLDVSIWTKRFLNNWKPKLIIWIESDLWPTTLHTIKMHKINAILLNLRLSPKSFKRWRVIPSFYNNLINCFSQVFAQSRIDQDRIQLLSNKKIEFIGNLKLTNPNNNLEKNENYFLHNDPSMIKLMLSSTHNNEENQIIPIIKELIDDYKHLQIFIAPRHPERSKEIISLLSSYNLSSQLESKKFIDPKKITIIDSFGILSKYFFLSDIVFLGGSLIPAGGHNPIEPAINKCAILTGSQLFNWQNIFDDMIKNNACLKIESVEELRINIKNLIDDKQRLETMKTNAYHFTQKQFINTSSLEKIVNKYMDLN